MGGGLQRSWWEHLLAVGLWERKGGEKAASAGPMAGKGPRCSPRAGGLTGWSCDDRPP